MVRTATVLSSLLLIACAPAPTPEPVDNASASTSAPAAAAAPDQRAWLRDFRDAYAALKAAARGEDVAALLRDADAAHALASDIPTVLHLRAVAQALNEQPDAAIATLTRLADTGLVIGIANSPPFASIKDDPRFIALAERFAQNGQPRGVIDLAFTAHGVPTDFIPESIQRDEANGRWLLGSVRHARIDAVDDQGAAFDFVAPGAGGLLSALGMRQIGDTLWVASAGFPQTAGIDAAQRGRSGLFEIDARSGAVRRSWWLPADGGEHALGDVLLVGSDVYTSDSIGAGVYRLRADRAALETVIEPGLLLSPQGLAATDEHRLYVADYPTGLWRFDRDGRGLHRLPSPDAALTGLDGLYAHGNTLIAIQNGTTPKRILRIVLDEAGESVNRVDVLAQNLLGWGEPSLATIHDGALYYLANSQWDRFDAEGNLPPADQLEAPRVMRLRLD